MIKIFFILNRKVTPQKNRCVGCWLLALPRAQMTRLSRILGVWFTYYVPVLINFMTPSKHLSIAYQGINFRRLLRFFFLSKAPYENKPWNTLKQEQDISTKHVTEIIVNLNNRELLQCLSCLWRIFKNHNTSSTKQQQNMKNDFNL